MKRRVAAISFTLLAAAGCSGVSSTVGQADKASFAQAQGVLQSVAEAEDEYYGANGSYTTDVDGLLDEGLRVPSGIRLSIPSADASGYCVQASGGVTQDSTWHLGGSQSVPLPGPCS